MSAEASFGLVQECYPNAELWWDGGKPYAFIPLLTFATRIGKQTRDVLICPHQHTAYPTRLFLSARVEGTNANINGNAVIGGRAWHSASWKDVPSTLPWLEILANHLKAFA